MLTSNFGDKIVSLKGALLIKPDECSSFKIIYPSGFSKTYNYPFTDDFPLYSSMGGASIDIFEGGVYQIIVYSSLEDSDGKKYNINITQDDFDKTVVASFLDSSVAPSVDTDNGNLVLFSKTSEIQFFEDNVIDICLVGGGFSPTNSDNTLLGSKYRLFYGGDGGEVINYYKYPVKANTKYSITVGAAKETTSAFGITTSSAPAILPTEFKKISPGLSGIFIFNNVEYSRPGAGGATAITDKKFFPGGITGGGGSNYSTGKSATYYGGGGGGGQYTSYSTLPSGYQGAVWIRKSVEEYFPIGGRIFYDAGDNGVTYTFYDAEYNIITDQTISSLSNAKYYSYNKMASTTPRRWYVYDNGGLSQECVGGFSSSLTNYSLYEEPTDAISYGLYYTNIGINFEISKNSSNCFDYIKQKNEEKYMGCADWFMGSSLEQDILRNLGWVDWYNGSILIHSSTLLSGFNSYWTGSAWAACAADTSARCFLMRSF